MCGPLLAAIPAAATALGGAATGAAGVAGAAASGFGGLGSILQVGGLLASVGGAVFDGIAQSNAASANAKLAARQADEAREIGRLNEERSRQNFREIASTQRAQLAASGVQLDSPTALQIGVETAQEATRDAHAVRHGATSQANNLDAESSLFERQSRNQRQRGFVSAAGTILTQAPSVWRGLRGSNAQVAA